MGPAGVLRRQPVDLLDVEDGLALEKRVLALARLVIVASLGLSEAVGIDRLGAVFALAHLAAQGLGLLVGHPKGRAVGPGLGFGPEQQDTDPAVGCAAEAQRPGDGTGRTRDIPGLGPGADAALEVGYDLFGDTGIEITPWWSGGVHGLKSLRCWR